jgi:hypothetical protein
MIAPDETTFAYLKGRPNAPEEAEWAKAVEYWQTLRTDDDAVFDMVVEIDATSLSPFVTWGTNPGQGVPLSASVPSLEDFEDPTARSAAERSLQYMGLTAGTPRARYASSASLRGIRPHPASRHANRASRPRLNVAAVSTTRRAWNAIAASSVSPGGISPLLETWLVPYGLPIWNWIGSA